MIPEGVSAEVPADQLGDQRVGQACPVPWVSTWTLTGSETPIA